METALSREMREVVMGITVPGVEELGRIAARYGYTMTAADLEEMRGFRGAPFNGADE